MAETTIQPHYTSPEGLEPEDYEYIDLVMESIRRAPVTFETTFRNMITRQTTFERGQVADPFNFNEHRPQPPLPLSPTDFVLDMVARRYDRGLAFDATTEAVIDEHPLYLEMLQGRADNSRRQLLAKGKMHHDERANPKGEAYGVAIRLARFVIYAQEMRKRGDQA